MRRAGSGRVARDEQVTTRAGPSQRESILRDLERQLGLEHGPKIREGRNDGRKELAQRARRILEDIGGIDQIAEGDLPAAIAAAEASR